MQIVINGHITAYVHEILLDKLTMDHLDIVLRVSIHHTLAIMVLGLYNFLNKRSLLTRRSAI